MPSTIIVGQPWNVDNNPPSDSNMWDWWEPGSPTRHTGTGINSVMDSIGVDVVAARGKPMRLIVDVDDELRTKLAELDGWFRNPDPAEAYDELQALRRVLKSVLAVDGD